MHVMWLRRGSVRHSVCSDAAASQSTTHLRFRSSSIGPYSSWTYLQPIDFPQSCNEKQQVV
jgi:hypothetical protein